MNKHLLHQPLLLLPLFLFCFFTSPSVSFASHSCAVTPFSKTILQGENVQFAIDLEGVSSPERFGLTMGDLPSNIEWGFVPQTVTNPDRALLVLSTKENAQIGSFGVIVHYAHKDTSGVSTTTCKLHLSIESRDARIGATTSPDALKIDSKVPLVKGVGGLITPSMKRTEPLSSHFVAPFTRRLVRGDSGLEVKKLQEFLRDKGYFSSDVFPTGYFGNITKEAVKKFQESNGIEAVGIVGPKTRALLNISRSSTLQ